MSRACAAIRYPRGFRRIIPLHKLDVEKHYGAYPLEDASDIVWFYSDGDKEVTELYNEYMSSSGTFQNWETILRVIKCVKRLIPDMDRFFADQRLNPYLHGTNFDYLYEVAKFINGGRRGVSNVNHLMLLQSYAHREFIDRQRKAPRIDPCGQLNGATRLHYVSKWLHHSGGIEDIVCTMYVLFGMNHRV